MRSERIGVALAFACLAVGAGVSVAGLGEPLARDDFESLAWSGLGFEITLAGLALAGAALLGAAPLRRLGLGPGRLPARALALLVLGTLAISFALNGVLEITGWKEHSALREFEAELVGLRGRRLALAVASFVVAAGVAEELLCRGLVQRFLVARIGAPPGIFVASLFFGILHVDPLHALFAAGLGIYLGLVAHLGASTRAPILCHVLNNGTAVVTGAYGVPDAAPTWPAVGGAAAAAVLALVVAARWRAPRAGPDAVPGAGPEPGPDPAPNP